MSEAREREAEIAGFLRDDPGWLAENAHLYEVLDPPVHLHGETLTDHMAAMIAAARAQAAIEARRSHVLCSRRQATSLFALYAVLPCSAHPTRWTGCPTTCLALSALTPPISAPNRYYSRCQAPEGWRCRVPAGRPCVLVREATTDAAELHGEAACLARAEALVRVPAPASRPCWLWRRANRPPSPREGAPALVFLGRALAAALHNKDAVARRGRPHAVSSPGWPPSAVPRPKPSPPMPPTPPPSWASSRGIWARTRRSPTSTRYARPICRAWQCGFRVADGVVDATRARNLAAVRSFFRFLARRHGVANAAVKVRRAPRHKRPSCRPKRPAPSPGHRHRLGLRDGPTADRSFHASLWLLRISRDLGSSRCATQPRPRPAPCAFWARARSSASSQSCTRRKPLRRLASPAPQPPPTPPSPSASAASAWTRRWPSAPCGISAASRGPGRRQPPACPASFFRHASPGRRRRACDPSRSCWAVPALLHRPALHRGGHGAPDSGCLASRPPRAKPKQSPQSDRPRRASRRQRPEGFPPSGKSP